MDQNKQSILLFFQNSKNNTRKKALNEHPIEEAIPSKDISIPVDSDPDTGETEPNSEAFNTGPDDEQAQCDEDSNLSDTQSTHMNDEGSCVEPVSIGSISETQRNTNKDDARRKKEEDVQLKRKLKQQQQLKQKQERQEAREREKKERQEARERQRQEKEQARRAKEQERLEQKKQKEKERLEKLEQKKQKELERQQEKALREEREKERQKIEQERREKLEARERAQSRIGNFFKRVQSTTPEEMVTQEKKSSDYASLALPFYVKDGVEINTSWKLNSEDLQKSKKNFDDAIKASNRHSEKSYDAVLEWINEQKVTSRGYPIEHTSVKLLQQMTAEQKDEKELLAYLSLIPCKFIKFYENIRPPYMGTYSLNFKLPIEEPFNSEITGFNYEYDSDLDWVNEEDDEENVGEVDNLLSGEEDDDDDEDEDDEENEGEFDGFLDPEMENQTETEGSKHKFIGPLIPTVNIYTDMTIMDEDKRRYFSLTKGRSLVPGEPNMLNPYRSATTSNSKSEISDISAQQHKRGSPSANNSPTKKQKLLISDSQDLLTLFAKIHDSTFSLGTVTELAQKDLPQYNKQTIKNTVKEYAVRGNGKSEAGRKWSIKDQEHWEKLRSTISHES